MENVDTLKSLIVKAQKELQALAKKWTLTLDSANFQAKSKEDFDKYVEIFEAEGLKFLIELSHAGRKINVYQIPEKLKNKYFGLSFVEISEPKPSKVITTTNWEFVSYVVADYDNFVNEVSREHNVLGKIRAIGDTKVAYYAPLENKVQFRNRSISDTDNVEGEEFVSSESAEAEQAATDTVPESSSTHMNDEHEARLRLMADFDNYRKMTEKRIDNLHRTTLKSHLSKILDIIDDFERIDDKEKSDGIKHIHTKLLHFLESEDVEQMKIEKGDKFDHSQMEAVTTAPVKDEKQNNTVFDVLQKGYKYKSNDEILRPAKVVVAKA